MALTEARKRARQRARELLTRYGRWPGISLSDLESLLEDREDASQGKGAEDAPLEARRVNRISERRAAPSGARKAKREPIKTRRVVVDPKETRPSWEGARAQAQRRVMAWQSEDEDLTPPVLWTRESAGLWLSPKEQEEAAALSPGIFDELDRLIDDANRELYESWLRKVRNRGYLIPDEGVTDTRNPGRDRLRRYDYEFWPFDFDKRAV